MCYYYNLSKNKYIDFVKVWYRITQVFYIYIKTISNKYYYFNQY